MKLIIQSKSLSINLGNTRIELKKRKWVSSSFIWSMIIILIGLYLDNIGNKKKKEKDLLGYTWHLMARSLSHTQPSVIGADDYKPRVRERTLNVIFLLSVMCVMFACRNSGSNRSKKTMMTNCWPFILHNNECQWHTYTRAKREKKRGCKDDEWHDNMIMCVYKNTKNDSSIREMNRQLRINVIYIYPERKRRKKIENFCKQKKIA
jgi:hypothetical protein